jgi:tripartite-type tricarboxylate transporter receptor subunit TctC
MKTFLLAALSLFVFGGAAEAQQAWPAKPVTIIVPFSAGGTTDQFGRLLGQHMQQTFGQPFVVENKPGAGGNIGAGQVAKGPKDGHMLLVGTVSTHAINPFLYKNLTYDTVRDFQPVSLIARLPNMLVVNPKIPVKTVPELVDYLKKNPDKLSYGSSGAGTSTHLAAELFKITTGTQMAHIPFRSSSDVMQNLSGGHIDLAFDNMTLAWPQAKARAIRALAVTSAERSPVAPDVPTVGETLQGFEATSWHGLFAPTGTPKPVVDKLSAEVKRILDQPQVKTQLGEIGAVASPMTPEQFAEFIAAERKKWEPVVKASGAKVE